MVEKVSIEQALESAIELFHAGQLMQAQVLCWYVLEAEPDHIDALCLLGMTTHKLKRDLASPPDAGLGYHLWYYNNQIQHKIRWGGVPTFKSPSDMWNYQEIIFDLKPSLVIEFGTFNGGATLFFAQILRSLGQKSKVLSVDINHKVVYEVVKQDPMIELMESSSAAPEVADRITALRAAYPGPVFAILDSDHTKQHVLKEMLLLRPLLHTGDRLIVEDSNINGHPVLPEWGEGPYEAMTEYLAQYPEDYDRDLDREAKFGFTFATDGFLVRR
jgi:cephalosporin hydroxylase